MGGYLLGLLQAEPQTGEGVLTTYNTWKKLIHLLHPYAPPPDPFHATLYCNKNYVYYDAFESELAGMECSRRSSCLFMGPEGVAAAVDLTNKQLQWCEMSHT